MTNAGPRPPGGVGDRLLSDELVCRQLQSSQCVRVQLTRGDATGSTCHHWFIQCVRSLTWRTDTRMNLCAALMHLVGGNFCNIDWSPIFYTVGGAVRALAVRALKGTM